MENLQKIASEYKEAEITCLFLHKRGEAEMVNLLTLIELVPEEQQASSMVGDESKSYMDRENIDKDYTIYLARVIKQNITEVLDKYENIENGYLLKHGILNACIKFPYTIEQEPPKFNPIFIDQSTEKTIRRILPKRHTGFRVWSRINVDKDWLSTYSQKFLDKMGQLTIRHLGFDISTLVEHFGHVYLFACNPILRKMDATLMKNKKQLLMSFHKRKGKNIKGCRLVIEEKRSKNVGFIIDQEITSSREVIELPYFPDSIHKRIYDKHGNLLENTLGTWANVSINMGIQETIVNLNIKNKKGTETIEVPKINTDHKLKIGDYDSTNARYLRRALKEREYDELAKNKLFIYFPNEEDSKEKAKKVVKELLNKASERCMILDPYFSASDLIYAFVVQNISIPIQIISSASFLKDEIPIQRTRIEKLKQWAKRFFGKPAEPVTQAQHLNSGILQYREIYPQQRIQCKVLKGKKSPLHDRYIVIDNDVYLLGSSLNEFGARATTMIKVPTPQVLIDQAMQWWNDEKICIDLEEYIDK